MDHDDKFKFNFRMNWGMPPFSTIPKQGKETSDPRYWYADYSTATHPNCKCGGTRFVRDVVLVGGQANGEHTVVELDRKEVHVPHIPEIRCLPDNSLMIETTFVDVYEQYAEVCTGNWNNPDDIVAIFKYKDENRRPK